MRVVGCVLERRRAGTNENEFLMVHRLPHKADGDTWGLPSGKVEQNDPDDISAITRELYEETGYSAFPEDFELMGEYRGKIDGDGEPALLYPTFRLTVLDDGFIPVIEAAAHDKHQWVTPGEAAELKLIYGLPTVFRGIGYWGVSTFLEDELGDDGVFIPQIG